MLLLCRLVGYNVTLDKMLTVFFISNICGNTVLLIISLFDVKCKIFVTIQRWTETPYFMQESRQYPFHRRGNDFSVWGAKIERLFGWESKNW